MKRVFGFFFFACIAIFGIAFFANPSRSLAAYGSQQTPKIMNLWFDWEITDADVQEIAKWDAVVFDMDQQSRFPDKIRKIRELNPNIKILAYVDSCNIAAARFVEESYFPGYALAHAIPESWYVHRGNTRVGFWPGAWTLNITDVAPRDANGKTWSDYLPEFIATKVWSTGLWDGIFLDNAIVGPTWFVGGGLDITGDGIAESDDAVNEAWKRGWKKTADALRARLGSDAIIMGNGSAEYASQTNGILFEDFPNYGWTTGFRDYQTAYHYNQKPSFSTINSNANNVNRPGSYRAMRLGLTTAMLANGYYSFDYGNKDHGQAWWYDEYDAVLGDPTGAPTQIIPPGSSGVNEGVWWRDYQKGAVVVNSTWQEQYIELPAVFERLRGNQDATVNSGALESALTVPARDGLLLYRRTETATIPRSTGYINGDLVRVYDPQGTQIRSAFFAQRTDIPGGAMVVIDDFDADQALDVAYAINGDLVLRYGSGFSKTIRPFGSSYKGEMSLAIGNTDRDIGFELAIGRPGTDEVLLVEQDGAEIARWHAYVPAFKGGVNVAIGDLDGDGLREVITGAGPSGGPHIRIFRTDGSLWSSGFFAFDTRERGGVFVSVGDVNGDGKDEIIAGSGVNTIPRVRIFDAKGSLLREFTLSQEVSTKGVRVSLSDINDDGVLEILAGGVRIIP